MSLAMMVHDLNLSVFVCQSHGVITVCLDDVHSWCMLDYSLAIHYDDL